MMGQYLARTFLFLLLISSSNCFGCAIPQGGPEVNSLVSTHQLDETGTYAVSAPKFLTDDLQKKYPATIYLAYSEGSNPKIVFAEDMTALDLTEREGKVFAEFKLEKKERSRAFIRVVWRAQPGQCSTYANSDYLN